MPAAAIRRSRCGSENTSEPVDASAAGYCIQESQNYARHTTWLAVRSGSLPDALTGLARLRAAEGAILIEPQLLRESRREGS